MSNLVLGVEGISDPIQEVGSSCRWLTSRQGCSSPPRCSDTGGRNSRYLIVGTVSIISTIGHLIVAAIAITLKTSNLVIRKITAGNFRLNPIVDFMRAFDFGGTLSIAGGLQSANEL
jgi:hypothetical protein